MTKVRQRRPLSPMHRKKGEFLSPKQEGRKRQKAFNKSKGRGASNLVHPPKKYCFQVRNWCGHCRRPTVACVVPKTQKMSWGSKSTGPVPPSIIVPVLPLLLCLHVLRLVLHRRQKSQTAKRMNTMMTFSPSLSPFFRGGHVFPLYRKRKE